MGLYLRPGMCVIVMVACRWFNNLSTQPGLLSTVHYLSANEERCPRGLLTLMRPLCRPGGDPKLQALQGSTGFLVGDVRLLLML